jgi:hypothetical protein
VRSFVLYLYEEEAAGGSGRAGGVAVAGGEDGWDGVDGDAMGGGGFDEGAYEVADHVVEETGAGDAVDEEVFLLMPAGVGDGADVVDGDG